MNAAFSDWHEFCAMGGYALYVWLAVTLTLISLLALLLHTVRQRRCLLVKIRQHQRREQRIRAAKTEKSSALSKENQGE